MRVPLTWLREYARINENLGGRDVAAALIRAGLEVETVETVGEGLAGPLVVGRVDAVEELEGFRKPIRYCQVDVGVEHGGVRGIVCGATNFAVGDLVPVALPGTVLPGGFEIASRRTYGHVSDGMICSAAELGLGEDGGGILVMAGAAAPGELRPGDDAADTLGIGEAVLDIAVTPDRGYCMSIRGVAREAATALDAEFADPGLPGSRAPGYPVEGAPAPAVVIDDLLGCPLYTAVRIEGVDPLAPTPGWMVRRLVAAGMRSISLAVDVTNYVMLELGQPLHAFDADTLAGAIVVRRARPGERLLTLDHVDRALDPDDLLIADDSGPIGLAGTMGGLTTEISESTRAVVLEAASFAPEAVARMARRHKLPSEASRRFERGVDPALPWVASQAAAQLLVDIGGGRILGGNGVGAAPQPTTVSVAGDLPARISGAAISADFAREALIGVGCEVTDSEPGRWLVTPPSWRPDVRDPADVVEEVVRIFGYDRLPATLPSPPAGRGLTREQRAQRAASRALAAGGCIEVLTYPFVGEDELRALDLDDERAHVLRLANPLSDEQAGLRSTLLPGLVGAAKRNLGRGADGVSLYEIGQVCLPTAGEPGRDAGEMPRLGVDRRPGDDEIERLQALLPDQPVHAAALFAAAVDSDNWWGQGRSADWTDAVAAAQNVGRAVRADIRMVPAERAPWHPGRCAAVMVDDQVVGYAGELHPRTIAALGLPARTSAMEVDLDALVTAGAEVVAAPAIHTFPVAKEDIALIVSEEVSAAEVERELRSGAGELLESLRLFDEYRGEQIPAGHRSLAFALRFRAPDRTLSDAEVAAARDAAVAAASAEFGARLRSG